ncbi:hypothetical protein GF326_00050 [Candidatus Bathyarchaeota archaeon]|nr:hypothetical protein [Candidatus Bathyarchaeota archaeon]
MKGFDELVENDVLLFSPPEMMTWGRMTALFDDPDGIFMSCIVFERARLYSFIR